MKLATILTVGLTDLAWLVGAHPTSLNVRNIVKIDGAVPGGVVFHHTDGHAINGSIGSPAFSTLNKSITACHHLAHDHMSPARTTIVRDDCKTLARQVQAANGFFELWRWSAAHEGQYQGLVHNGTCEFAVKRLGLVANESAGDVGIIGNQDILAVLNASVFDFAGQADEPFMDEMRTQGHMDCKYWFSVNTTMEFRIQHTGSGNQ